MSPDDKHRLFGIRKVVVENCKVCEGVGYILDKEKNISPCECMVLFRWLKALVFSRIPQGYWALDSKSPPLPKNSFLFTEDYIAHLPNAATKGLGLFFRGPNGTGKTTLLTKVGRRALAQGYSVGYLTTESYLKAVRSDDQVMLPWVSSLDFILLDEIDKPYRKEGSDYIPKQIEEFIRQAIAKNQALVIAGNESVEGFQEMYGSSIASALTRVVDEIPVIGDDLSELRKNEWRKELYDGQYDYHQAILLSEAQQYRKATYASVRDIGS